jgi:hypothetical protein
MNRWEAYYRDKSGYMHFSTMLESFYELTVNGRVLDPSSPHGLGYRDLTNDERAELGLE